MCGIYGFNWKDKNLLAKMSNKLEHRGPNSDGKFIDNNLSLGHRRLSIIDLTNAGNQPIYNEDESILVVFNGEIYNFKKLRKILEEKGHKFKTNTDTEVIVHGYEEYGFKLLDKLEGMFAFCIYDRKKDILFLARDQLGVKPLFYYFFDNKFIFASEPKAILQGNIKTALCKDGLAKYMKFHYLPDKLTLYENIHKLLAGHYMLFNLKHKKIFIKKYWFLSDAHNEMSESYYIKKLLSKLNKSVKEQMVADVPVATYLSGGIDSSLVASIANQVENSEIKTFSVGFGEKHVNELNYAKKVSDYLGTVHTEYILDENKVLKELDVITKYYDEPVVEGGAIPNYFLSKFVSKNKVKVVLAGEGGDEVFGGYSYYDFYNKLNNYNKKIPLTIRKLSKFFLSDKYKQVVNSKGGDFDFLNQNFIMNFFSSTDVKKFISSDFKKIHLDSERDEIKDYFNKLLYIDIKTQLSECFNAKFDRTTMANSIEGRVPLQSKSLVEFAFKIPSKYKYYKNVEKYVVKKAAKDYLPKEIINRKKQGYSTPMQSWVNGLFKDEIMNVLRDSQIVKDGFLDSTYVEKILNKYDEKDFLRIWSLFTLEKWYRHNKIYF